MGLDAGAQSQFNLTNQMANAFRVETPPVIDGKLDDAVWRTKPGATNFTQNRPFPQSAPTHRTEVWIAYDDQNLYVGAQMHDPAPDSILQQLSVRDRVENSDEFGIWFSPYNDGINSVGFSTTPRGALNDFIMNAQGSDDAWNGVWEVKSQIHKGGWSTEIRVPWSQFRMPTLPDGAEQVWGMNIWRTVRRSREETVWNALDPTMEGMVNQGGILRGIEGVNTPPRIALFPYVSAYSTTALDDNGARQWANPVNGGLDAKVGIGDAFTVDMTLVPDFGQVVTDNLVLNLSPFEVQFAENRPFFLEGTDLFNKGGLFYSRRIGSEGQLFNATKISGRTASSTGIGVFQAFARDTTDGANALTSYNVTVVDQNLPNNGYVTALSAATVRSSDGRDAYVQGTEWSLRNQDNSLALTGNAAINTMAQGDITSHEEGHKWGLELAKTSGQFRGSLGQYRESEWYNPNDLGYLAAPNEIASYLDLEYGIYQPFGAFNRMWWNFGANHNQLYAPRVYSNWNWEAEWAAVTQTFWFNKLTAESQPSMGKDWFASRIDGLPFETPRWSSVDFYTSTDYRRQVAIDGFIKRRWRPEVPDWNEFFLRLAPRFRFSDKLSADYVWSWQRRLNERGWVSLEDNPWGSGTTSLFGRRENTSHTHVLNASYIFTPTASLSARNRHYWSIVDYEEFYSLQADGTLGNTMFNDLYLNDSEGTSVKDLNYNAWSVDLVYRWMFSPGSELSLVWKNTLNETGNTLPAGYWDNWKGMLEESFTHSISLRALYFLDYSFIESRVQR
ncbi:MAG: DUF5916 domain-containing protein [Bacteroidota bacterium]|nr:DUF5916 domain-containing protein [Bacteroidota bacterium]